MLPVKLGDAYVKHSKWSFVHILNLEPFLEEYTFLKSSFHSLNIGINRSSYSDQYKGAYENSINITSNLFTQIELKLEQIIPASRIKRGLLNPLGTFIKALTGNLDNEDAQKYDSAINTLRNNQNYLKNAITNQISIMNDAISNFQANIESLKKNQIQLESKIMQIEAAFHKSEIHNVNLYNYFLTHTVISQFSLTLQIMMDILNNIETAISFSRSQTFHGAITSSNILLKEIQNVTNLIKPYCFPFDVNADNLIAIEKLLVVKAYVKSRQITFILELATVKCQTYNYFEIYPIPNTRNLILIPSVHYFLENSNHFITSPSCKEIQDSGYICSPSKESSWTDRVPCEIQLTKFVEKPAHCQYMPVAIKGPIIEQIKESAWILHAPKLTVAQQTCGTVHEDIPLRGTYVIETIDQCSLTIENNVLETHNRISFTRKKIQLPQLVHIDVPHEDNVHQIQPLHLEEINTGYVRGLERKLQTTRDTVEKHFVKLPNASVHSAVNILVYILVGSAIIFMGFKCLKLKTYWAAKRRTVSATQPAKPCHRTPTTIVKDKEQTLNYQG